jgi:hypothetical protein
MLDQPFVPTLNFLYEHRQTILALAAQYGVSHVRVFGSVARGEASSLSDIDFLVDFPPHFSLLDLSGLVRNLQLLLQCRVQVVSAAHLRDELRTSILQDAQPL